MLDTVLVQINIFKAYRLIRPRECVGFLQLLLVIYWPSLERGKHHTDGQLRKDVLDYLMDDVHDGYSYTNTVVILEDKGMGHMSQSEILYHMYKY